MAKRNSKPGDLLTVEQVADFFRLSKLTVYKFIHSGELPAVRLGRSFRVRQADVGRFLEAHMVAALARRAGAARAAAGSVSGRAREAGTAEAARPVFVVFAGNREVPADRPEEERLREVMMSTNPLEWIIRGLH